MVKFTHKLSVENATRNINSKILAAPVSLYNSLFLKSFSYHKLPEQIFKLSVLKLDGSSFGISVPKNATVAEVKRKIEEVFEFSSEGEGKILWSLVWSHFCLCYEDQKLIKDKAFIRFFGIRDGDQIYFIRHMTIDHKRTIKQSGKQSKDFKYLMLISEETNSSDQFNIEAQEEDYLKSYHCGEDEPLYIREFKLAQYVKGWLSYTKLWGFTKKASRGKSCPLRL